MPKILLLTQAGVPQSNNKKKEYSAEGILFKQVTKNFLLTENYVSKMSIYDVKNGSCSFRISSTTLDGLELSCRYVLSW